MNLLGLGRWMLAAVLLGGAVATSATHSSVAAGATQTQATGWVEHHGARSRLVFGGGIGPDGAPRRYAGLEIELQPGWKTYWRQPGSAGGIPPVIEWSRSTNLRAATLEFPAPVRMTDNTGDTIGYKERVTLPIALEVMDATKPVRLVLDAFFGVCREICVPATSTFDTAIAPDRFRVSPPGLALAISRVPETIALGTTPPLVSTPSVAQVRTLEDGGRRLLEIDVTVPGGGAAGADVFAEMMSGQTQRMGLAMTRRIATEGGGKARFQLPLSADQWSELRTGDLYLTVVVPGGGAEVRVPRPVN